MTTSPTISIAPSVAPADSELVVTTSGVANLALPQGTMLGRPEPSPGGWWTTSLLSTPDHPALIVKAFVPENPA